MVDIITYDDIDTLFSEETVVFMEKASAPVKKSYISKMFEAVKSLVEKVSRFISDVAAQITGKKVDEAIRKNPKLGEKKVSIKKYNESVKAGNDAIAKLKKAKTPGECKRVRDEYDRKRKKILAVTATVTVATIAASAGALAIHNKNLKKVAAGLEEHQSAYEGAWKRVLAADSIEDYVDNRDEIIATATAKYKDASDSLDEYKKANAKAIGTIQKRAEKARLKASAKNRKARLKAEKNAAKNAEPDATKLAVHCEFVRNIANDSKAFAQQMFSKLKGALSSKKGEAPAEE